MLKKISVSLYVVTAILYVVTMAISFKSVSNNLDGWHGFKSGHVMIFILIGVFMIAGCINNMIGIWIGRINFRVHLAGVVLIVLPVSAFAISVGLKENVETDLQYLTLRTL